MPAKRAAVSCSIVCWPVSASSCFGYISRDNGHSRVPAPPDKITGVSFTCMLTSRPLAAADRIIAEAGARHVRRVVEIAAVEYHRRLERRPDVVEIRAAELAPLGDDRERVRALQRLGAALAQHEVRALCRRCARIRPSPPGS